MSSAKHDNDNLLKKEYADLGNQDELSQSRLSEHKSAMKRGSGDEIDTDPEDAAGRKSVLTNVAGFIIVTEFCERLAYYGFAGSLVLFLQTQLNFSNVEADVQYSAWSGFCYMTPLVGGYIADTYLGRYRTIMLFCLIYLGGLVMVVIAAVPGDVSVAVFFPAIYIIAIGTGGIKPNVSTMGADQFDDKYSKDRKEKESFFNWFYWSINLGALIAYTLVSYICQYGIPSLGGEKWGFFIGYSIPAIMMALAIAIFVLGTPRYRIAQPQGSVLATAAKICYEAVWTNRNMSTGTKHILDRAKTTYGGNYSKAQVEGVKLVTRLTPYLAVMVPFWGIYSQMSTAFQNQGCQMDLTMGGAPVPVSALNCFDTLAILMLVPFFDGWLYPYFKKIGYPLSMLQKIGLGFVFAMLAMFVAGFVEIYRVSESPTPGNYLDVNARNNITPCQNIDDFNPYNFQSWYQDPSSTDQPAYCSQVAGCTALQPNSTLLSLSCIDCDNIPQMSKLSVFWQVPQFALVGTSEILASITSLEFFYSQAPFAMRSVTQSLNLFTTALGSWIVIPILLLVNSDPNNEWVPRNVDGGHLDWYFFLLSGLMGLNLMVFYFIAKDYEYKSTADLHLVDAASNSSSFSSVSQSDPLESGDAVCVGDRTVSGDARGSNNPILRTN
eukprot:CAMPEP_0170080918 /NCGR_PEP_ID=MMETSP0019_2-20121128/16920_1 /TAXON_ID=98059 /ORGANISM="Dinobryon sp., Strain UTEXLB2267" /LENGTH=662 /DNA_ID=CAMNT_0010295097 /DNA_START=50 /DNA_END=2038 /DNA_ORIENTATION=-